FGGVRATAANALGRSRSERAANALVKGASDKESRVRRAAVSALAGFRNNSQAAATILKVFQDDSSYAVQADAASALARIGHPRAFEVLTSALTRTESHEDVVRRSILTALVGLAPADRLRPIVFEWTAYGKDPNTRPIAISLLPGLGEGSRPPVV